MDSLNYLTVQDMLWINLHVTGAPQAFRYADLEEATFYQYGYGNSQSLLPQASQFVSGFLKKQPFAGGNEASAMVACIAFLTVNGAKVDIGDPVAWIKGIKSGSIEASQVIDRAELSQDEHGHDGHEPDVKAVIAELLASNKGAIAKLTAVPA
ncbi:MAG: hypothetical protein IT203_03660 [Fimbriimonadaceae bacterium]|nr:hypothetical protein [Fimbriimonadaceae bacterium]